MKNIKPYFMIIAILAMLFVGCPNGENDSKDDNPSVPSDSSSSKITSLQAIITDTAENGVIDLSQYNDYEFTSYSADINKAVTIKGAGKDFGKADITVNADGVNLSGMNNVKTLTASASLGNGSLKIASSSLSSLNILGGGSHSIYIEGHTTIDILTVNKEVTSQSDEFVRLVIDDTVSIDKIVVQSGLLIDATGDGSVNLSNVVVDISNNTVAPIAVSSKVTVDVTDDIETVKVVISDEDIPEAALTIHAIKNTDLTTDFVTSVFEILVAPLSDTAKTALEAELDPKLDSAVTGDINIELEDLVETYGTKHRIVYENNIGAADLPIIIDLSTDYTLPTVEVTGARFIGWSVVTDDGTTDLTDNILHAGAYTGKITLAMRWDWNTYTVTFMNGDVTFDTQDVTFDCTADEPTAPTKNSTSTVKYTFAYWYVDNNENVAFNFDTHIKSPLTLYAKWNEIPLYSVTIDSNIQNGTVTASHTSGIEVGTEITLTVTPDDGYFIGTLTMSDGNVTNQTITDKTFSMPAANVTINATFTNVVSYQEATWNGSAVTYTTKTVASGNYTILESSESAVTLENGKWYVVSKDITITDTLTGAMFDSYDPITVSGTVNIILCDGATLTAKFGINVESGKTLNIYAQSGGTGKLVAGVNIGGYSFAGIGGKGGLDGTACGTVNIHGGNIVASGGETVPGIGGALSGGTVTIYGGVVTATGGQGGAGIGGNPGGTVKIYGGDVTATGVSNYEGGAAGIGGNAGVDNHGTLTVASDLTVTAGSSNNDAQSMTADAYISSRSAYVKITKQP